jgi:hypothetical protein
MKHYSPSNVFVLVLSFCYYSWVFAKVCFEDLFSYSFLWFRCWTAISELHSLCADRNWLYLKISNCILKLLSYDKIPSNRKVIKFGGTCYHQLQDIKNLICWRWSWEAPQKHQYSSTRQHDVHPGRQCSSYLWKWEPNSILNVAVKCFCHLQTCLNTNVLITFCHWEL